LLDVSTGDIMKMKEELCSLKLYGQKIKEVYLINEQAFKGEKLKEKSPIRLGISTLNRLFQGFHL